MGSLKKDECKFWHLANAFGLSAEFSRSANHVSVKLESVHFENSERGQLSYFGTLSLLYVLKNQGILEESNIPNYYGGFILRERDEPVSVGKGMALCAESESTGGLTLAISNALLERINKKIDFSFDPEDTAFSPWQMRLDGCD